jgi:hypothetical protein
VIRILSVFACLAVVGAVLPAAAAPVPVFGNWTPLAGQDEDHCPPQGTIVTFADKRLLIRSPRGKVETTDAEYSVDRNVIAVKGSIVNFHIVIVGRTISVQGCRMRPAH